MVASPRSRRRWLWGVPRAVPALGLVLTSAAVVVNLPTVVRGGWVPVVLRNVQVTDADGLVVLRAATVRAEIDVHRVLGEHHDVVARRVVVSSGDVIVREVPARAPRYAADVRREHALRGRVALSVDQAGDGHFSVPSLDGTYDCTRSPGPPVQRRCEGRSSGDARVLLRLRKLDTW